MSDNTIENLARRLLDGQITADQLVAAVSRSASVSLPDATLDLDRQRRCGFPEVVYAEDKSTETLRQIFQALVDRSVDVLATRLAPDKAQPLLDRFAGSRYNDVGRTFRIPQVAAPAPRAGRVAVVTAGTSDLAVAEECRETLDWMGTAVTMIHDVGVAGPHRLVASLEQIRACDTVVVVAGMEGALPSVVAGHVACPVIAVPTSVGYGASFGGLAALLGMLNSCAANVTVVNIDAGFKAGYVAGLIATRCAAGGGEPS